MKKSIILDFFLITLLSTITFIVIVSFILKPVKVYGNSMYPNFENGDIVLVNRLIKSFKRNDVVVIRLDKSLVIKRIIALEGDDVYCSNGEIFVNGENKGKILFSNMEPWKGKMRFTVSKNSYFVLGDNRESSIDSRNYGEVEKKLIYGKVIFNLNSYLRKVLR